MRNDENFERFLKHLMGYTVLVRIRSGKILSGIFHEFKPSENGAFSIALKMCKEKDDILAMPREQEIINSTDFVELKLDLLHLSINRRTFLTDTEISVKGNSNGPRTLKPWNPDEVITSEMNFIKPLDDNEDSNWDQYKHVKSTYSEEYYTTVVDRNSKAYLDNVEKFSDIEAKIQQSVSDNPHVNEERGLDFDDDYNNEERFTTVMRPNEQRKKNNNILTQPLDDDGGNMRQEQKEETNQKKDQSNGNTIIQNKPPTDIDDKKKFQNDLSKFSKDIEAKVSEKKKKKKPKLKLNLNAQEFKPSPKNLLPSVSSLHPYDRKPPIIDITTKISSLYHKRIEHRVKPSEATFEWPSTKNYNWNIYDEDVPDIIEAKKESIPLYIQGPYYPPMNPYDMGYDMYGSPNQYMYQPQYAPYIPTYGIPFSSLSLSPNVGKRHDE